jgi:hypothetical protein
VPVVYPNESLEIVRRNLVDLSLRVDRLVRRTRRDGPVASRSHLQAVESLRHKRDTLLIRFWLLEREVGWPTLPEEIQESWRELQEAWRSASRSHAPRTRSDPLASEP